MKKFATVASATLIAQLVIGLIYLVTNLTVGFVSSYIPKSLGLVALMEEFLPLISAPLIALVASMTGYYFAKRKDD
jgi:hypothetical protein